ncbi:MAG: LytTR family transcriptional regulator [Saprospiraceae bacterium]|nr:LytTR family transcriptional regulator [Saprospiraceae bacterium]
MLIPTQEGFEVIRHDEITRIEADRAYCVLHQKNGRRLMISKPLRELKDQLPTDQFFRCHSSHLIRLSAVVAYRKEGGGVLVLCDGSHVPVAKARKEEMVRVLGG